MKKLKDNKPLRYLLGVILFILLSCYLPQQILFWKLCTEQDQDIPPNTEVLVSACKKPGARGVPDGETLFVREVRTGRMYLLDLRTGEKRKLPNDPLLLDKGIFLSSDLVWLRGSYGDPDRNGYRPHYVLDLTNGKRYELIDLNELPLKDGRFDPKYYEYIKSADHVFLHHRMQSVIGLSSDLERGGNVIFRKSSLDTEEWGERLENLLKELGIKYEIIDFSLYHTNIPSPENKYYAGFDGIYLMETNQRIPVNAGMFGYFRGWYYDESGVVVQDSGDYLLTLPGISNVYYIPSPILKLNLP
ncbi:MAG TPA: hypothetical protein PK152_08645 [Anaerolineales bacterium]|nr:hypothetical protein [Anaerolineales bacterium]